MGKCPFSKNCNAYNVEDRTCTKDGGCYYGPGRFAGCGRDFILNGKKSKYYKKRIQLLTFGEKIRRVFGFHVLE